MSSRDWRRFVLTIGAVLTVPVLSRADQNKVIMRVEALRHPAIVDCGQIKARSKPGRSFPRVTDSLVRVGEPIKLNDESAPASLTGGVWSPSGDSIAFVAPTARAHP